MELTFFSKDKKTPLLRPRLANVVDQFSNTQACDGISTGRDEYHIHVDVMAPGLVGDFKDGRPRVLIAPSVPHLAEDFPLKNCCISSLYVSQWGKTCLFPGAHA
jgi:hypothetical protein